MNGTEMFGEQSKPQTNEGETVVNYIREIICFLEKSDPKMFENSGPGMRLLNSNEEFKELLDKVYKIHNLYIEHKKTTSTS